MYATLSAALTPMTGGTSVCLSVVLLVNKFQYWLAGGKKTTFVVKPSFMYKRNDYVMKTFVLYIKYK